MPAAKRYSKKREAILEVIRGTCVHPSADWVYQQLKPDYPDLSLGTVYRNLAAFRQEGIITSVGVVKGQERFDAVTQPHSHFVCTECGGVEDLCQLEQPSELIHMAGEMYGLRVDRYQLTLEGVCKDCLKKDKKSLA